MLSDKPRPGDEESDEPSRLAPVVGAAGEVDAPLPGSTQPPSSTSTAEILTPRCHASRAAVCDRICGGLYRVWGAG